MATRLLRLAATCLVLTPVHLIAQGVTTIQIDEVQLARSLDAVVHDPAGSPMAGVLVEELSPDWKKSLRSTKTNAAGAFTFALVKGRRVYYFQFTSKNFNPLRVRVKVDRERGKKLELQMELST